MPNYEDDGLRSLLLIVLSAVAGAATLPAAAATIQDCEKIKAADAYNQCLASFGPAAHEHELKPVPAGIGSGQMMHGHSHYGHYAHYSRHGSHRAHLEISVAPGGTQD